MNFFDALSILFKDIREYIKVFLAELLVGILMIIGSYIPLFGGVILLLLSYYSLFLVPVGLYTISQNQSISFKNLFQETYNICSHPGKSIQQVIKIFLVSISSIIVISSLVVIFVFEVIGAGMTNNSLVVTTITTTSVFFLVLFIVVISMILLKMNTTLEYMILSQLLGDTHHEYLETHRTAFQYDFLWKVVPILNIVASYGIMIRFIELYKQEKQIQEE